MFGRGKKSNDFDPFDINTARAPPPAKAKAKAKPKAKAASRSPSPSTQSPPSKGAGVGSLGSGSNSSVGARSRRKDNTTSASSTSDMVSEPSGGSAASWLRGAFGKASGGSDMLGSSSNAGGRASPKRSASGELRSALAGSSGNKTGRSVGTKEAQNRSKSVPERSGTNFRPQARSEDEKPGSSSSGWGSSVMATDGCCGSSWKTMQLQISSWADQIAGACSTVLSDATRSPPTFGPSQLLQQPNKQPPSTMQSQFQQALQRQKQQQTNLQGRFSQDNLVVDSPKEKVEVAWPSHFGPSKKEVRRSQADPKTEPTFSGSHHDNRELDSVSSYDTDVLDQVSDLRDEITGLKMGFDNLKHEHRTLKMEALKMKLASTSRSLAVDGGASYRSIRVPATITNAATTAATAATAATVAAAATAATAASAATAATLKMHKSAMAGQNDSVWCCCEGGPTESCCDEPSYLRTAKLKLPPAASRGLDSSGTENPEVLKAALEEALWLQDHAKARARFPHRRHLPFPDISDGEDELDDVGREAILPFPAPPEK